MRRGTSSQNLRFSGKFEKIAKYIAIALDLNADFVVMDSLMMYVTYVHRTASSPINILKPITLTTS